jgi:hypothetical protein
VLNEVHVLGGAIRLGGRRAAAIGLLVAACLLLAAGRASADADQKLTIEGPAAVDEGGTATYTIKLTDGPDDATVTVSAKADSGTEAEDLTEKTVVDLKVPKNGEAQFTVDVKADDVSEPPETFTVSLSGEQGASVGTRSVQTTINDKSALPVVTIGDAEPVKEGNAGTTATSVRVTLSAKSERVVSIPWSTAPGTATADDFVGASGTLVIQPGAMHGDITVQVKGDTIDEANERFSVVLTAPTNATLASDNIGEITILDDDDPLKPTVPPAEVKEGNEGTVDLTFKVTLGGPRPATTFNYRTVAESANGTDYVEVGGAQLPFPAGDGPTTKDVKIRIKVDTVDELDETLWLEILDPSKDPGDPAAVVARAKGTILDDDTTSALAVNDTSVDEPSSGEATLTFTVTLLPKSDRPVKVNWATANGTAIAGSDYVAGSGTLSFAPGETAKEVKVTVTGDGVNEPNETLTLRLSGAEGARIGDAEGQGTLVDKSAPPSLSIDDVVAREGEVATFTITLAGTTTRPVTVTAKTGDGSAQEGADYVARRTVFTFQPGERTKTFVVVLIDDPTPEGVELFYVTLEDVINGTITKARGTGTIDVSDGGLELRSPTTTVSPTALVPTQTQSPKTPVRVQAPRMVLGPRAITVGANGIARMLVTCQAASPITCAGSVELERATKPVLKLGKRTFSVKKGKKAYASIKLSARSLALLRKSGTMRARVVVVYKKTVGTGTAVPGIVTLTAAKTKAKPAAAAKPKAPPEPPTKVEIVP